MPRHLADLAMPIHDWTRVPAGLFHDFHQSWTIRIKDALNMGRLPRGLAALVEQRTPDCEPDFLTVKRRQGQQSAMDDGGGLLIRDRPSATIIRQTTKAIYAGRANRIVVRHHLGRIVAVIEVMSPGNKDSRAAIRDFVDKAIDFLRHGVHLLIVDLFPPTSRDPDGIHKLLWDEIDEDDFALPPGKDRLVASYETGDLKVAFLTPLAVGDHLPDAPLFVASGVHVLVPLEATYCATWDVSPEPLRVAVETGEIPDPDADEE
jgi:hypothetical protein